MNVAAATTAPVSDGFADWMKARSTLTVAAALTLALCTFFGFTEALFVIASQLALIAVLVRPDFLVRLELWLVLAIAGTLVLISDWSVFDNHKYLLVYWLWVMTIAAYAQRDGLAEPVLTSHARFFLVFIFLMAAAQKMLSPTYMSGEMFEIKLLLDRRFAAFAQLIGIDPDTLAKVRLEIASLRSPLSVFPDNARVLSSNDLIRTAAQWITWYDLLIQIAIGAFFLFRSAVLDRLGHLCLLFFIYTTYLPAPVFGFGWLLSILGFILARKSEKPWIVDLYLASFVAIMLYQLPWREWVVNHG
jgi:hypothetical protein